MRVRAGSKHVAGPGAIAATVLLAAFVPRASAIAPEQADTPVPTVIVTPDNDLLSQSDRKLAKLIKSLPGADAAVAAKKSMGEKIGDYYDTHRDPNDLSADSQRRLSREMNGDPDRQNLQ